MDASKITIPAVKIHSGPAFPFDNIVAPDTCSSNVNMTTNESIDDDDEFKTIVETLSDDDFKIKTNDDDDLDDASISLDEVLQPDDELGEFLKDAVDWL
jgi:hypothetical protein